MNDPEIEPRTPADAQRWVERIRHFLAVDPGGCWVAIAEGEVVAFAVAQNRGQLWFLATYGVLPPYQGQGVGTRLLEATLAHADGRQGMLISTVHPGATRRYRLAGFSLFPLMRMVGTVDRAALPRISGLRDGRSADFGWMDRLDTALRGAGHGPDHVYMLRTLRLVVSKVKDRPGYVYVDERGRPTLLAAAHPETASDLLREGLASSTGRTLVNCITTANQWAVDVGLSAGLDIGQEGYLAIRGMDEPTPYLASGHFL